MRIRQSLRLGLVRTVLILVVSAGYGLIAELSHPAVRPGVLITHLAILLSGLLGALLVSRAYTLLMRSIERVAVALQELGQGRPARIGAAGVPEDLRALAHAVNASSDTLSAREHELHDQLRRTALLTRLAIDLHASLDQDAIARDILAAIGRDIDACDATIVLADADGAIELAQTTAGGQLHSLSPAQARQALEYGPASQVLGTGSVRLSNNALAASASRSDQPIGSVVALPLTHGGATFGVLTIRHPRAGQFSSHDLLLFEAVAAQSSLALGAARLRREAQIRREQALLLSIGPTLAPEPLAAQPVAELLERSAAAFDAEASALFLAESDREALSCFTSYLAPAAREGEHAEALLAGMAGVAERAWQAGAPISALLPNGVSAEQDRPACVALLLQHNGATIGAFALARRTAGALKLPADAWAILAAFTDTLASAFARPPLAAHQPGAAERAAEQARVTVNERRCAPISDQPACIGAHQAAPAAALLAAPEREPDAAARGSELLHTIFDHLPDGLVLLDGEGRILIANEPFCEDVLGILPRAAIGQQYDAILQELERCGQLAIEPHPCVALARRARCTTGAQQRWYQIDRYAAESGAGMQQLIERWRDTTRQEQQRHELQHDEQLTTIARLAASVVHEIGNPLQSVRSCIDLSREDTTLAPPTAEYLELAGSELTAMAQILGRLRDLYRLPLSEATHD